MGSKSINVQKMDMFVHVCVSGRFNLILLISVFRHLKLVYFYNLVFTLLVIYLVSSLTFFFFYIKIHWIKNEKEYDT